MKESGGARIHGANETEIKNSELATDELNRLRVWARKLFFNLMIAAGGQAA